MRLGPLGAVVLVFAVAPRASVTYGRVPAGASAIAFGPADPTGHWVGAIHASLFPIWAAS